MCQLAVVYSAARRELHDEKAKVPGKSVGWGRGSERQFREK